MNPIGLLHTASSAFMIMNVVVGILVTLWIQKDRPSQDS